MAHNPAGEERLKELVESDVVPKSALDPDFRVGMIIDHKVSWSTGARRSAQEGDHWLVYRGDEASCWYVTDELVRLS